MLPLALILAFLLLVLARVPLAIAIGLLTLLLYLVSPALAPVALVLDAFQSLDRFPLLAVPLFILAGHLMSTGGVAKRILHVADVLVGDMKGAYALVTIGSSVFFGGLSGSAPATVAAVGSVMIPAMIRQGYAPGFAAGVAACAGVLGIVIPPSNPMIVYALVGNASVGRLFMGGILPGLLLALGMAIPAYLVSRHNGWSGDHPRGDWRKIGKAVWSAKWALLTPVIILGGIYSGVFTPTESAAVACLYALIVGLFIHREFSFSELPKVFSQAALPVATVMLLVTFATALGNALTMEGVPQHLAEYLANWSDSPVALLLLINVSLLLIGCFMDTMAAIIILTPLLLPVVESTGMSSVHFGVILVLNLGIGFVSPPFGSNLFVANQISQVRIQRVFLGALPMVGGMLVALLLVTYCAPLVEALPGWLE
jgi:C4-dicarboxylate transporter DctM subunit